jgi:hypothetical protein
MAENSKLPQPQGKTAQVDDLNLLPRSAWHSQLTYLKVLLKAKQALDKRQYSI